MGSVSCLHRTAIFQLRCPSHLVITGATENWLGAYLAMPNIFKRCFLHFVPVFVAFNLKVAVDDFNFVHLHLDIDLVGFISQYITYIS